MTENKTTKTGTQGSPEPVDETRVGEGRWSEDIADLLTSPDDYAIESKLAAELLSAKASIHRAVLFEALGWPRRYSEFKEIIRPTNDNNLTSALKRLDREGLVRKVAMPCKGGTRYHYGLTHLGIRTALEINFMEKMAAINCQIRVTSPPTAKSGPLVKKGKRKTPPYHMRRPQKRSNRKVLYGHKLLRTGRPSNKMLVDSVAGGQNTAQSAKDSKPGSESV